MSKTGSTSRIAGAGELVSGALFAAGMPLLHLAGYIGGVIALPSIRRRDVRDRGRPFLVPFALLLIFMTIRALFLEHPRSGLIEVPEALLTWGLPFVAGLAVARKRDELFSLYVGVWVVMVTASLLSAVGVLPEYLVGRQRLWSEGMIWATHHHNDFAACMLFLLPVLLRRTFSEKRAAWLPVLAVVFVGFVLSGSRGYYLAFPFVILGFLITDLRDPKTKYSIGAVLLVLFVILAVTVPGIRTRFEWMLSVDASILTRLNLLRVVGWVFSENPLAGIGPGQLAEHGEYLERLRSMGLVVDVGGGTIDHLHNVYATVAVEGGLIGLGLFAWMLLSIGRMLASGDRLARALFWGYVGLMVGNLSDTQLMGPSAGIDFFFLAGLFSGTGGEDTRHGSS